MTTNNNLASDVYIPQTSKNIEVQPEINPTGAFDPFDVSRLKLTQDFLAAAGVKKVLNTIPVRKPSKEWFIRTHPDAAYRIQTNVIDLKEDSEVYLVDPSLWQELISESCFSPRALVTTINRQNVVTLWPIRLPGADGKIDDWNRSALEASTLATKKWVRINSNRSLGAYEVHEAIGGWGEPEWNLLPFQEVLRIAFKDRFIQTMDHAVLKRLRGEV